MKEHGIIFKAELVRAIFQGTKTQTRRVPSCANTLVDGARISAKRWKEHEWNWDEACVDPGPSIAGYDGPFLKVQSPPFETGHRLYPKWDVGDLLWMRETFQIDDCSPNRGVPLYRADYKADELESEWRPSIHMPRWASRLTLKVKRVWPERVQEIGIDDARAEGMPEKGRGSVPVVWFADLWDEINGKRGWAWELNRPVWCIEFSPDIPPSSGR